MTNSRKPGAGLTERRRPSVRFDEPLHDDDGVDDETGRRSREGIGVLAGRVSRWFQGLDPEPMDGETVEHDMLAEMTLEDVDDVTDMADETPMQHDDDSRFPLVRYGYSQGEVDRELMELERQLAQREREIEELRNNQPPMSIAEELERIGEQTASILVVAHDQAHETTRRAQEQAERCIADAAANAVQITAEAKEKLRELDEETDAVWRERERLLEDTRTVSRGLTTLVDEAIARFPAADKPPSSVER